MRETIKIESKVRFLNFKVQNLHFEIDFIQKKLYNIYVGGFDMDKKNDWNLELSEYIKQGEPNQVEKEDSSWLVKILNQKTWLFYFTHIKLSSSTKNPQRQKNGTKQRQSSVISNVS